MKINENGFIYIQLIIVGVIIFGTGIITFDRLKNLNNQKNWIGNNQSFRDDIQYINSYFINSQACLNTFGTINYSNPTELSNFFNKFTTNGFKNVSIDLPNPLTNYSGSVEITFKAVGSYGYDILEKTKFVVKFDSSGTLTKCHTDLSSNSEFENIRKVLCEDLGAIFTSNCAYNGVDFTYETKGSCPTKQGFLLYQGIGNFNHCNTGPGWDPL